MMTPCPLCCFENSSAAPPEADAARRPDFRGIVELHPEAAARQTKICSFLARVTTGIWRPRPARRDSPTVRAYDKSNMESA
jgi:hypothetical protein